MATTRGGDKLKTYLKGLARKLADPGTLRVGFLEGATYPNGTPVAMIAAIQDYGSPINNIPPRPFFRNMIAAKSKEWPKAMAGVFKSTNYDAAKTLAITGEAIAGQLRQSIIDTNAPPLSPATIARKGFAKPLIDSSVMINSVAYEVT